MADLLLNIIGTDGASAPMRAVAESFRFVSEAAKQCVEEFEKQEKADRQLHRAAGDLTDVFKRQASAMQEQLGVSDDMVQGIQTMLLRFGEAPANVEATTRAILDYSAATGTDAVSATHTLLTGVQAGKSVFKDLGLQYEKTGSAAKDLTNVTQALANKIGGAAASEADSLSGQSRKAHEAVGELEESVGQLIVEFINKTGAVGTFTEAIKGLQEALFGTSEEEYRKKAQAMDQALVYQAEAFKNVKFAKEQLDVAMASPNTGPDQIVVLADNLKAAKRYADETTAAIHRLTSNAPGVLPSIGTDRKTNKKAEANAEELADYKAHALSLEALERAEEAKQEAFEQEKRAKEFGTFEENLDTATKESEALLKVQQEGQKKTMEEQDRANEKTLKKHEKLQKDFEERNQKFEVQMEQMGSAIGMAFVNALNAAIQTAGDGGEVDVLGTISDIAFSIAAIAGATIANIYAPGTGTLVGGLIGTAGNAVHSARASAWRDEQSHKHHDGGRVGQYHSGGWPGLSTDEEMIIAQKGEAVWSRRDVASAGGPAAVDRLRQTGGGGGGLHVTVVAQDSNSVREFFEDRGGRGIFNAIRTGRGPLTALIGR